MQNTLLCNTNVLNLYIENKYHHLELKKIPITFEQGCNILTELKWLPLMDEETIYY